MTSCIPENGENDLFENVTDHFPNGKDFRLLLNLQSRYERAG